MSFEVVIIAGLCLAVFIITAQLFRNRKQLKEARNALKQQEKLIQVKAAQIDAANDAIVLLAPDGQLEQCNRAFCDMTGYSLDELLTKHICDLAPSDGADVCDSGLQLILSNREATVETVFRTRSGRHVTAEISARVMESDDGKQIIAIVRNISDRKRSELRERTRLFILEEMATGGTLQDILNRIVRFIEQESEHSLCSILLADNDGDQLVLGASPSLPEFYSSAVDGTRAAEGSGFMGPAVDWSQRVIIEDMDNHPFREGFAAARDAGLRSYWSEPVASAQGDILGTITLFRCTSGTPNEAETRLVESAAHLASIAIERYCNETGRMQLEEQLHHVQRIEAVGQLAGGIAHDFNNLLTPILGYADLIFMKTPATDPMADMVSSIVNAAQKARDLTQQLLSFGRKQTLIIRPLDLNSVINGFQDIMRRTIRENIAINVRTAPGSIAIRADQGQIEQILLNMAVNAQDAIKGNGTITIETGHIVMDSEYVRLHPGLQPGPYALLSFSDNGCGMDDATLAHIFEPFFTTKRIGHGTGLGLASVYGIIKQHEGSVTVRSSEGKGTTFCIYLPLCEDPVTQTEKQEFPAGPGPGTPAGQTILVAEDNDMVRTMIVEVLKMAGYRVLAADSPTLALELARQQNDTVSLLVSDVVMPEMSGHELYEKLLDILPDLNVLYISGYTNELFTHNGILAEEVNFLQKPFTTERLLERVGRLVAGRDY